MHFELNEVRIFLDCSGHFKEHSPHYAAIAAPLTKHAKRGEVYVVK